MRTALRMLYRSGRRCAHQSLSLAHQVRGRAGRPVSGQDAEHGAPHQLQVGYEVSPGLVRVVEAVVVRPDAGHAAYEEFRVEPWPVGEVEASVPEGSHDLGGALWFMGTRHVGRDVGDDEVDVMFAESDRRR